MAVTKDIVPSAQTLRGLLNQGKLRVPRFQRAYSWKNPQVDQLFSDLDTARSDNAPHYFIGAMVLQDDGATTTIVDGQQRLATLSIALAVLRDHPSTRPALARWIQSEMLGRQDAHGNWTPALELCDADRERFRRSISLPREDADWQDPTKVKKADCEFNSQYRIVAAYTAIRRNLNKLLDGVSEAKQAELIHDLANTAAEKIAFITISVPTDDMAYTVFETLNERGLGLSVSDLLKNYLLSHADTYEKEVDKAWGQLESTIDPDNIPKFLRHRHMATKGTIAARQLYKVTKSDLGGHSTTIRDFVRAVRDDAKTYAALSEPDASSWSNSGLRRSLSDLKRLRATQCLPLLLSCAGVLEEKDLLLVTGAVEAFTVRYSVIGDKNPNELEPFYSDLAIRVKSGKLSDVATIRAALAAKAPDDADFATAFSKLKPVNPAHPSTRYLLERLEVALWKHTGSPPDMYDPARCHLEHLLPQTLTAEWEKTLADSNVEHADVLNLLGNLTLLEWKLNIKNGNSDYAKAKANNLGKSVYKTAQAIAAEHTEWNPTEILARQANLAKQAVGVWSVA